MKSQVTTNWTSPGHGNQTRTWPSDAEHDVSKECLGVGRSPDVEAWPLFLAVGVGEQHLEGGSNVGCIFTSPGLPQNA